MGQLEDALKKRSAFVESLNFSHLARKDAEKPGFTSDGVHATVTGEPGDMTDPIAMMVKRGLNPDEWKVDRCVVNEWEVRAKVGNQWIIGTNHQLKCFLTSITAGLHITNIQCDGHFYTRGPAITPTGAYLACVLSDQQIAGIDKGYDPILHQLVLRWIDYNKPKRAILSGDFINGTPGSKYPETIEALAMGNEELLAGHKVAGEYREAIGQDAWMQHIDGNHEHHYVRALLAKNPALATLRAAGDPSQPLLFSTRNLLQFDSLGIECATGHYPHGQVLLTPSLAIRHGWMVRSGAAASALATLTRLGYSVIVGHTHRGGETNLTHWTPQGEPVIISAYEAYTLCQIDRYGQGYTANPDWQGGFLGVHVFEDGMFTVSPAKYNGKVLVYEDQRYWMQGGSVRMAA